MKVIINWLVFLLIIGAIVALVWHRHWIGQYLPKRGTMTGPEVIVFALALAFVWVEALGLGKHKPFNCLKCLTGWFALILAFTFHVEFWYMYVFIGVFAGAVFSAIKMRWL
jgi:hypothetical protein